MVTTHILARMRTVLVAAAAAAAVSLTVPAQAAAPTGAAGKGVPQATCFWFGPMSIKNKATNLAYPDEGALYWGARFRIPAGSKSDANSLCARYQAAGGSCFITR